MRAVKDPILKTLVLPSQKVYIGCQNMNQLPISARKSLIVNHEAIKKASLHEENIQADQIHSILLLKPEGQIQYNVSSLKTHCKTEKPEQDYTPQCPLYHYCRQSHHTLCQSKAWILPTNPL